MNEGACLFDRSRVYLASARLLIEAGDYESAVSRGYYAMFFAAEAALLTLEIAVSSHKGVLSEFNRLYVKTGRVPNEMGCAFSQAFAKRQLGEYEFRRVITKEDATDIEKKAGIFVEPLADLLKPHMDGCE